MQPIQSLVSRWYPVCLAILGFVVIAPSLWSGWLGDDAFYSMLDGVLGADKISLSQAMLHSFQLWFFGNGRFYPGLIVEKYLVFYFFTNLLAYKLLLIAMTLVAVELFRRCVAAFTSASIGNLAALIVVTLFAERGYQDAILSYNAMPQVVAIAMLTSLLAFRRALTTDRPAWRVASVALYALAAFTYEDAYLLCLLYPALLAGYGRSTRDIVRSAGPYVAIGVVLAAFSLAMRHVVHLSAGSIYARGTDPVAIMRTGVDQVSAAFPLSYWLFDPSGIFGRHDFGDFYRNAPVSPLVFSAFAVAAWWCLQQLARDTTRLSGLLRIGALVLVLPAIPIALTVKYQHELKLGLGYLPVFFEVFGVALLGAALAKAVMRRFPSVRTTVMITAAIAICGTMTQATNVRLVRELIPGLTARTTLESQLDRGLMSHVPDRSVIALAPTFDWIAYDDDGPDGIATRALFYMHGGRRIDLVAPTDPRARYSLAYDALAQRWSIQLLGVP